MPHVHPGTEHQLDAGVLVGRPQLVDLQNEFVAAGGDFVKAVEEEDEVGAADVASLKGCL